MTEIPRVSSQAFRLRQDRRALARDELETTMVSYWIELSAVQPGERTRVGRRHLIQLLGAYAGRIFEIGAGELVNLKLEPIQLGKCLDELASEVHVHMIPPQFRIQSGFCLTELEYDEPYRSHIRAVIEDCVREGKKNPVPETEGADHRSPYRIIARYCEREKCTVRQLAVRARVDESVIYAIKANRKRCSADALARIAGIVGCEPGELAPEA
jgi:Cro/C1-type HTH DNA-binding domain